jgi:hypothetical protein
VSTKIEWLVSTPGQNYIIGLTETGNFSQQKGTGAGCSANPTNSGACATPSRKPRSFPIEIAGSRLQPQPKLRFAKRGILHREPDESRKPEDSLADDAVRCEPLSTV